MKIFIFFFVFYQLFEFLEPLIYCGYGGTGFPALQFHDGVKDCVDGSDENMNAFVECGNGRKRIKTWQICNGLMDCLDNSDEDNCKIQQLADQNNSKFITNCALDKKKKRQKRSTNAEKLSYAWMKIKNANSHFFNLERAVFNQVEWESGMQDITHTALKASIVLIPINESLAKLNSLEKSYFEPDKERTLGRTITFEQLEKDIFYVFKECPKIELIKRAVKIFERINNSYVIDEYIRMGIFLNPSDNELKKKLKIYEPEVLALNLRRKKFMDEYQARFEELSKNSKQKIKGYPKGGVVLNQPKLCLKLNGPLSLYGHNHKRVEWHVLLISPISMNKILNFHTKNRFNINKTDF